jgi:hypothetical protein
MPLEMGGNECKLQPKTHERVTQKPQELSNPKQRLAKRLKKCSSTNQSKRSSTNQHLSKHDHHYKIKVHVDLIFSIFSPLHECVDTK